MIKPSHLSSPLINIFSLNNLRHHFLFLSLLAFISFVFLNSCSPTERFTKKEETNIPPTGEVEASTPAATVSELRVMLQEVNQKEIISIESLANLYNHAKKIKLIPAGSMVSCSEADGNLILNLNNEIYNSEKFSFNPVDGNEDFIKVNGKKYRGKIQVSVSGNSINLINVVSLEDYVKGVLPKEMPLGKNDENFEALKALAVCIRTYAIKKVQDGKIFFDLYSDTRDQVYGGVDSEHPLSNKAVDETQNLILTFEDKPALLFYHSTCGGYTESVENVFTSYSIPYMKSIEDGDEPFCKISPRYSWIETYTKEEIISRLINYSLLENDNYELNDISIANNFESGRVADIEIIVNRRGGTEKNLKLHGNEIRSILRTSDNKNILWSTMFDVLLTSDKVILTGKGYGHGVGLCQWGAIALSRMGNSFEYILDHYYPGTTIGHLNDQN